LWTYWILAGLSVLVASPTIILKGPPPLPANAGETSKEDIENSSEDQLNLASATPRQKLVRYYAIFILVSSYLFLYVGAEASFGGWIFSYSVDIYGFSKSEGAYLSAAFWGALTVFRLVGVPISLYLSPHAMLILDMLGCLASLITMIAFVTLKSKALLWILTLTFGACMASVYATAFSLPQTLKINITSRAASLLIVGVSIGDMVLPMFVGWIMRLFGSESLPWTILIMFIVAVLIYVVIIFGLNHCCCWWCHHNANLAFLHKKTSEPKKERKGDEEETEMLTVMPTKDNNNDN